MGSCPYNLRNISFCKIFFRGSEEISNFRQLKVTLSLYNRLNVLFLSGNHTPARSFGILD